MAFSDEVLRINERYLREVVETFDICPWARKARETGELVRRVLLQRDLDTGPTLDELARIEALPPVAPGKPVVVAIFIYPHLGLDPLAFDRWVQALRALDEARHQRRPAFAAATFHPDYRFDDKSPARLVPYLRRSPDPSIQWVRLAVLEDVRGPAHGKFLWDGSAESWPDLQKRLAHVPVNERIAQANHDTVAGLGPSRLDEIYASIRADRDAAYARFPLDETGARR